MDREGLLIELERPRNVRLSQRTWEAAAVVAGLRVAVNDSFRAADRDRGREKNWLADIWGVIGELVALRVINAIVDAPVRHCPIDFERSVNEVDLVVSCVDGPLRVEAKAHLLEPGKAWFMVNQRARDRSDARGAVGYVPVVSALGAERALIGRLIAIEQLRAWEAPSKVLRDPAVGIELMRLYADYLHTDATGVQAAIGTGRLASADDLQRIAAAAADDRGMWRQHLPALGELPAAQVVDAIQRLL